MRLDFVLFSFGLLAATTLAGDEPQPPRAGRGAGTVPIWNPHRPAPGNPPITLRVLVLDYDPIVPFEGHRRLSEVFGWNNPAKLAGDFVAAMEHATGGYLRHEIVEWRNLDEIYAQEGGKRHTIEEYVRNRRAGSGWPEHFMADYPRLLTEQNVAPLIDEGRIDEVWVFSDHFFGVWEASMAGPGAFFINGGVYPDFPTRRPFAFYGFNYERGVAEMMHDASHRTEATMNRAYGEWKLATPTNLWEKFSANDQQSGGAAGIGTCHWPANAQGDYDYGNRRLVQSWADGFLGFPAVDWTTKPVNVATWSDGKDPHLDYMKWYFAHVPRAAGADADGRQGNWLKYIFDFQSYDAGGRALPPSALLLSGDVADPAATDHELLVAYRSADQIDPGSLGDDDLVVTGPDGLRPAINFVGGAEAGFRSYRVGRYRVTAPLKDWHDTSEVEFEVALQPGKVTTCLGEAMPGSVLGRFRLARAVPGATLTIELPQSSLLPGGRAFARAVEVLASGESTDRTRSVAWSSSAPEIAAVEPDGTLRFGKAGKATLTARLGALTATALVNVVDPGLPTARLRKAEEITEASAAPARIVVTFESARGMNAASLRAGCLRVFGPNGFHEFPEPAAVEPAKDGKSVDVTFLVAPPSGQWGASDRGTYLLELPALQAADRDGRFAPATPLGTFRVSDSVGR